MLNMYHDPEVPAGYQDADIEMLEMAEAANTKSYENAFKGRCGDCRGKGGWQDYNNYGDRTGWTVCDQCGGAGELF